MYNSPKRKRELKDALSEAERSFFKSLVIAVVWWARECRFETLGTAATLSQMFETSTVQHLVDLQKTIEHLKETADVCTLFRPTHPAEMVIGHVADGSLLEKGEIHSRGGCSVFCDDPQFRSWTKFSSSSDGWYK